MARKCPITGNKVVYLECQECEDKVCRSPMKQEVASPKISLEHNMQELIALQLTQNHFGRLHGEITGAHILHSQTGKWAPDFPDKPTEHQQKILDEAITIVNTVIQTYDLTDLSLKMARVKFVKAEHGMYKFVFYDDCFYVIIFDRKAVEEWYQANIENILNETEELVKKEIICYPKEEWECTDSQGYSYDAVFYVGNQGYYGTLSWLEKDSLERQIAYQLVCCSMDPYIADFLKEHGVYE